MRVYEVAKELNVSSVALVHLLREMDLPVRSHMTMLADEHVARVRARLERERRHGHLSTEEALEAAIGEVTIGPRRRRRREEKPQNTSEQRTLPPSTLVEKSMETKPITPPYRTAPPNRTAVGSVGDIPEKAGPADARPKVFIVHGRDEHPREATARLVERLGFEAVILHERPHRGHTILEKFLANGEVQFAIILLTPDDRGGSASTAEAELGFRARQNVVFEFGFFVGALGRERVCALYRGNLELPSDIHGLLYVRWDEDGAWNYKLANEMKAAGLPVDLNLLSR